MKPAPTDDMKIKLVLILALSTLFSGCAGRMTPPTAQSLTTLAVYGLGKESAKLTKQMRELQPLACVMAISEGATLADVATEIEPYVKANPETKLLVTTLLSIFQTSVATYGTNVPPARPYLKAVFCDGWKGGLDLLPNPDEPMAALKRGRNAPPVKLPPGKWVFVK